MEMTRVPTEEEFIEVLALLAARCPRLLKACYWSGTSPIILEETHHRQSYDIDLHTLRALRDVRPLQAELQRGLGKDYRVLSAPDSLGSGFRGSLDVASGNQIVIEVLASFESPKKTDLIASRLVPAWRRVGLRRYTLDKLQCVVERAEARDLVDLQVMFRYRPELAALAQSRIAELDQLLLAERLLSWSDGALANDLKAYPGVDWQIAARARDQLLDWLNE
jgi:hypothetical protein